ncbi:MAG: HAD family phosphatase [Pseudomonadota bacterium]|nr:HAD family phosphatase [Pseudomonadota bacterium]
MAARIALFDLGRVVLDWEPARLYAKIIDAPQEREKFLTEICNMTWHTRHDAGASFAENADDLIRQHPQYEAEIRAWGQRWLEMFDGYVDGTPELMARLDARRVPLYALSNMPSEPWDEMLTIFDELNRFRHVVVSGRIGMVKPSPEIFHHALDRMGGPDPDEVLFIDDSLRNVEAAGALGFRTHHFTGAAGLDQALTQEGLL